MANSNTNIVISAEDKTLKAFDSVKRNFSNLSSTASSFSNVLGGLGVGLSVAGLTSFVTSIVDSLDHLNDLSKTTGIAVEQLSGLSLAAKQSGGDLDSIASAINKLSVNIGKDSEKFKALGITAKDPLEAFKQLSDVFKSIEDPQKRAALAAEALGKSWQGAAPLLAEGGKAIGQMVEKGTRLSGVTKKMAEDSDKFNDRLAEMGVYVSGLTVTLGSRLLKTLDSVGEKFKIAASDADIYTRSISALQAIASLNPATFGAKLVADFIKPDNSKQSDSGTIKKAPKSEIDNSAQDKKVCEFTGGYWDGKQCLSKPPKKETGNKSKSEANPYLEEIKSVASLTQEIDRLNDVDKSNLDLVQQKLDSFTRMDPALKAYNQSVIDVARSQEMASNDLSVFADTLDRDAEASSNAEDANQSFRDAQESGYTDLYNQLSKEQEDFNVSMITNDKERIKEQLRLEHEATLQKIYEKNLDLDSTKDLIDIETKLYEDKLKKAADTTNSISKDLGLTFKSAFEDAIVGTGNFSDALQGLEQDIIRLAARRTILDPLLKAFDNLFEKAMSSGGSSIWESITSVFTANADGNVYSGPSISAYSGSVVSTPTFFARGGNVMGEAGPEAILPLKRGADGKLGVSTDASGSGMNVTVNLIESPGNGGQVKQKQDGNNMTLDIMVEKIEGMMGRNISQGKGIAPAMERQYGLNRAAGSY